MNKEISNVVDWSTSNSLILNPNKTQAIVMGTSRYVNSIDLRALPRIMVGAEVVEYATSVKYLGVTISNNFSWEKQVAYTTKKIRSALYQLKISKYLYPATLRLRLVTSLILPHLDYCCAAFTDMTNEQNGKFQRALNDCVRFIISARPKIGAKRSYFVGCLLCNVIQTSKPLYIYNNLTFRSETDGRDTRNSMYFITPQCRIELFKRSFRSSSCRLWNGLPQFIRDADSMAVFKERFYVFLMNQT